MTVIITDIRPKLKTEQVLEGQGIDPKRAKPFLFEEAKKALAEAQTLIEPLAMYDIVPVEDFHHQTIVMASGASFEGPLAARALAGSRTLALAVCTIGPALEERMNQLFGEEPVRAMALDGAGVAALRSISEATVARIREEAEARRWGSGMRAQPGQEGWSIWQQRVLFDHIPADEIGVRLTDSALMIPRKSVSFVIGMGPDMRPDAVACDFCSKRERCPWHIENNDQ